MMFDVIGFGALNLDRLYYVDRVAKPGEHQPVRDVFECPGGSAANTIAWLADSGFKTGFIGAVGRDSEGEIMLGDFKKRKVDVKQVRVLEGRTGMIIGFVDSKGERTLYPYPGVNNQLTLDKKMLDYARNSKFIHLTSFVNAKQFQEQKKLVRKIPDRVKISFSPGDLYAQKGFRKLKPILEKSFVLFLNQDEIQKITGFEYQKGANMLNGLGVEIVVVTLGNRGCYLHTRKEKIKIACKKCKPVDTTGAGDAFCAGFLSGLLKNKKIQECGKLGNQLAGGCIMCHGARQL